jgi:hypothetical protein
MRPQHRRPDEPVLAGHGDAGLREVPGGGQLDAVTRRGARIPDGKSALGVHSGGEGSRISSAIEPPGMSAAMPSSSS